jgi:2-C-methyl-D-erythritol 4-phosphate cytidylyltransferase
MNCALIFAGGAGIRINSRSKPKQFLELSGKAIIVYTLEHFELHPEIDGICVVCLESWIDYLKELLNRHRIEKVKWIVPGGKTGQLSIYNGLRAIFPASADPENDVVLIHDGVRPLINAQLISGNIGAVKEFGSAITVAPVTETVVFIDNQGKIREVEDRNQCRSAKAPQSFRLAQIMAAHEKAGKDDRTDIIDSATLMGLYGYPLHTVSGSAENIKITTPADFYMFRAILQARENSQIFGL